MTEEYENILRQLEYWLGVSESFIKIGDNKEEIMKLFEE